MHIQIFDKDSQLLQHIHQIIREAAQHTSTSITLDMISSPAELADAGIFSTPTVCIDGKVFAAGYVPTDKEISRWLSRLGIPSRGPHAYACVCGKCMPALFTP